MHFAVWQNLNDSFNFLNKFHFFRSWQLLCVLRAMHCIAYVCVTIVVKLFSMKFHFFVESLNSRSAFNRCIQFNSIQNRNSSKFAYLFIFLLFCCFFFVICSWFSDQLREGKRNLISTIVASLYMVIYFFFLAIRLC